MKHIIFTLTMILSAELYANSCEEVAKYDEMSPLIFVVCPNLPEFDNNKASKTVRKVFSSRNFVPDEYVIYFVKSQENLGMSDIPPTDLVGSYYTHSNELTIWPDVPGKMRVMQIDY